MQPLKINCIILTGILLFGGSLKAQDDTPRLIISGYLKYMQNLDVTYGADSILNNHLMHNRINLLWLPREKWTVRVEFRNRMFYGDYVEQLAYYKNMVDVNNDIFDLSAWILDHKSLKMLSEIDRAYIRYTSKKTEFTAGRQRLSWGLNEIWNPNDIFNAYSFFDFDYEERPASDILHLSWHYDYNAKVEVATKFADNLDDYTGAILWKITQYGFDVQILSGLMENNIVMGTGWAGDLSAVIGIKGEISYFGALDAFDSDAFVGSVSADYKFPEGTSLLGSYFYNSDGIKDLNLRNFALFSEKRPKNAKHLLPFRSALMAQVKEPINPLLEASFSLMLFPGNGSAFVRPAISYAAGKKIKLDLLSQIFTKGQPGIDPASFQLYLRAKFSF